MARIAAKGIEHGTQVGRRGGGNAGEAQPKGLARRRERSILALLIGFTIGVWLGIAPVASATVPVSPSVDLLGQSSALDRALSEAVSVDGAEAPPPVTPTVERPAGDKPQIVADYGRLPMHFEPNMGQTAEEVRFLARGPGYTLFLTDTEVVMVLRQGRSEQDVAAASAADSPHLDAPPGVGPSARLRGPPGQRPSEADPPTKTAVVRMRLEGATLNAAPVVTGLDRQPGISNYFLGNDPTKWRTEIPHYARVQYDEVYAGIDLVFYGNPQQLEYDFVVSPGADPEQIRLAVSGADAVRVNEQGDLVLSLEGAELVQRAPRIYQEIDGEQRAVAGGYRLLPVTVEPGADGPYETIQVTSSEQSPARIGFELAAYDQSQGLVIDPVLVYSTYLGGSENEEGHSIAVDIAGNTYVAGWTFSSDFPTVNAIYPNPYLRDSDAFIFKLNAAGTAAFYSTYLGGSGRDTPSSITVDSAGNAYVTGDTQSSDFPTVNALYPNLSGYHDAFIFKLNAVGSAALYSTYLGGSNWEEGFGIAVDDAGSAYVTGLTGSLDFPTVNALYPNHSGQVDTFIFKLNAVGSAALYSTYLGGSEDDRGWSIAVDIAGNAYVTGYTESSDFPTVNALYPNLSGYHDAFVFKLNAEGSAALYSTYLGGSDLDWGHDIAVDDAGNAYVTGHTDSSDFPTFEALYPSYSGNADAYVFKLNAPGTAAIYSTYLVPGRKVVFNRKNNAL
ncbi:SBBP repeat-containing protein [Thiococcus pfennigii]|uniref:DUF7948 domain-containing protein n=1 Tax=Thiococcus pfennigii TaxID=1057 RepID=UPI001902F518|nr:SBBP repeat-containing protein [Thiococcus pfennigii]MBK1702788.1 hypothetical protein [Thiococcus pfennigii]